MRVPALPSTAMTSLLLAAIVAASPTPAPTPAPLTDPCGSIMSIVTRPSVATNVCTVRPHRIDLETGYTATTVTGAGTSVVYPQPYLRIGSGEPHVEYDLQLPSSIDSAIGFKDELGYSSRALWGFNAQMSFPTGRSALTAGRPQYTLNAIAGYTLSPAISLSGMAGFDAIAFVPSIDCSVTLSPRDGAFVEYAYFSRAAIGLPAKSQFDGGLIHDLNPHVQLDVEYGLSPTLILGRRTRYTGAGISFMS